MGLNLRSRGLSRYPPYGRGDLETWEEVGMLTPPNLSTTHINQRALPKFEDRWRVAYVELWPTSKGCIVSTNLLS